MVTTEKSVGQLLYQFLKVAQEIDDEEKEKTKEERDNLAPSF